jgi:hypothetical protein
MQGSMNAQKIMEISINEPRVKHFETEKKEHLTVVLIKQEQKA